MWSLLFLVLVMVFIIVLTSKVNLHPFLVLLFAAIIMGLVSRLPLNEIIDAIVNGFGGTLKSIGIVIACGTIIGTFLEKSGGARKMADVVLKMVGEKKSPLAMSITGFIVSIPVFCDSGFVILSSLAHALARRTGISLTILTIALGTGLYTTHVFVPPTPGPLAAAAALDADIGLVILLGLLVSIPVALAGLLWAKFIGRKIDIHPDPVSSTVADTYQPGALKTFAPILLPILLISLKSVADFPTAPFGTGFFKNFFDFIGNPIIALLIGVLTAFLLPQQLKSVSFNWVSDGLKSAGSIILITGAGGAFGSVLKASDIGTVLGQTLAQWPLGIFLPFIIAAALKSAQGSSTVAIITTSAMLAPLLSSMGFVGMADKALVVLAVGAGAMTVSHANDSYFWVVSQFSKLNTANALKSHTLATLVQGVTGIIVIAILNIIF